MTTVWRKDPCYFEIGLEKEHRCTLGHHCGPRSATTLRMEPNYLDWSRWQRSASPRLEIPEVFTKTFYWAVVALHPVTRSHTKPQQGVSIHGFMRQKENRWLVPAHTTNGWQCVGSSLANVAPLAPQRYILWWSSGVNSTRKASPVLLSSWIEFKVLAVGVYKILGTCTGISSA